MKIGSFLTAMLLATLAVAAHAGEIVMYENPGLSGRQIDVRSYMPDIKAAGFGDHHASVLVKSGTWEVCADANFKGFCATLQPNEYRSLDTRFNERIFVGSRSRRTGRQRGSLIVSEGTWELCSEGGYGGNCQVFEPGRYADLGPLTRDISSARLLRNRNEPRRY